MTKVKICGITDAAAFDSVVAAGADYVGFVFFPPSPRAIMPAEAAVLSARHVGGPARVGLFVQPDDAEIAAVLAVLPLDALQLHNVDVPRAREIRAKFGVPVWRAIGVAAASDLPDEIGTDLLMLDAKPPQGATRPGGNAVTFDWGVLAAWHAPGPWMLAGGLTADNVANAIRLTGAPVVDASSSVESAPGVKDPARIRAFVAAVRG